MFIYATVYNIIMQPIRFRRGISKMGDRFLITIPTTLKHLIKKEKQYDITLKESD